MRGDNPSHQSRRRPAVTAIERTFRLRQASESATARDELARELRYLRSKGAQYPRSRMDIFGFEDPTNVRLSVRERCEN